MDSKPAEKAADRADQKMVKGWNYHTVKVGGVIYPPRQEGDPEGPHEFPEGPGLDSLVEQKAVVLAGRRARAEREEAEAPKPEDRKLKP